MAGQAKAERGGARRVPVLNALARRPRGAVFLAVGVAALAGWAYLAAMVTAMVPVMDMSELGPGMGAFNQFSIFAGLPAEARAALAALCLPEGAATFGMPVDGTWSAGDAGLVFVMWVMMALAMMLPSAAPMIATYSEQPCLIAGRDARALPVVILALGYLSVWVAYAIVATTAQGGLTALRLVSPMMAPASLVLAGTTLIAAGIYQFTPAKLACLMRCRRPVAFFVDRVPADYFSVFRLGVIQGLLCLGCCWALMTVMFAVGIMNVVWIAVLGLLMAVEKTVHAMWVPRAVGVLLLLWGSLLLAVSDAGRAVTGF